MGNSIAPPENAQALLRRASMIAGYTVREVAELLNELVPDTLHRDKGWIGVLLERYLGATGGNRAVCDFPHLGIELKTIPIDQQGRPIETTFVCVAPLMNNVGATWATSYVREKLRCVLWIPIEGELDAIGDRRIGCPILWRPDEKQEAQLQQDWEELMDYIVLGQVEQITAKIGDALHLRPKAANGRALTDAIGQMGVIIQTRPRGFYLRTHFTHAIVLQHILTSKTVD